MLNFKKQWQNNVTKKGFFPKIHVLGFFGTDSTVTPVCCVPPKPHIVFRSVITKQFIISSTHQSLCITQFSNQDLLNGSAGQIITQFSHYIHAQLILIYQSINNDCELGFLCLHSAQLYYTAHYIPNYLTFSIQAPVQELAIYFIQMEGVRCQ